MTQFMNMKRAKVMASAVSVCFLLIHIGMLVIFTRFGVTPMASFNIFSVTFYLAMLPVIRKQWFRVFALSVYLEVVAHMTLAAYFTGWGSGFQITLIGMSILLYYSEYVGRCLKIPYVKATHLCLVGMAAYLAVCVIDHSRPAPYPLPGDAAFWLQIFWGVVVFVITMFYLYIFVNLTAGSEELLSREVNHDQLTGLPNRYFVTDYLNELNDGAGLSGHWAAMVDIDDFKAINDTYGHNCGDYILKELASMLTASGIDMKVSRWGGEEFLLFGRIDKDLQTCLEQLDGLRRTVMDRVFEYEQSRLRLTVTIGLADYQSGSTIREWIGVADQKLYVGKTNGKNQVVV